MNLPPTEQQWLFSGAIHFLFAPDSITRARRPVRLHLPAEIDVNAIDADHERVLAAQALFRDHANAPPESGG